MFHYQICELWLDWNMHRGFQHWNSMNNAGCVFFFHGGMGQPHVMAAVSHRSPDILQPVRGKVWREVTDETLLIVRKPHIRLRSLPLPTSCYAWISGIAGHLNKWGSIWVEIKHGAGIPSQDGLPFKPLWHRHSLSIDPLLQVTTIFLLDNVGIKCAHIRVSI